MTRQIRPEGAHSIAPDIVPPDAPLAAGEGPSGAAAARIGGVRPRTARRRRLAAARSCRHPHHHRRHHAGDVPVRARADHRRAGIAGDRQEPCRLRQSVLGRDRLSSRRDGGDAAIRQAHRYSRPPHHHAAGDRHFHRRLARLCAGANNVGVDRRPRPARHRRRRAHSDSADDHCRPLDARASGRWRRAIRRWCS